MLLLYLLLLLLYLLLSDRAAITDDGARNAGAGAAGADCAAGTAVGAGSDHSQQTHHCLYCPCPCPWPCHLAGLSRVEGFAMRRMPHSCRALVRTARGDHPRSYVDNPDRDLSHCLLSGDSTTCSLPLVQHPLFRLPESCFCCCYCCCCCCDLYSSPHVKPPPCVLVPSATAQSSPLYHRMTQPTSVSPVQ